MPDFSEHRPTWAEINLDNLAFNFKSVKSFVGEDVKYMAVVKADAYGHGAVPCAKRLESEGVDWFGVALPEEGVELRRNGIRKLILSLGGFWPGQEKLILNHYVTPVIYQADRAEILDRAARERGSIVDIHVKIDTGMGRVGVRFDSVAEFADRLKAFKNLRIDGVMTHFAAADRLEENDFTELQLTRFKKASEIFREKGFRPTYFDMANSPGAVVHPAARGNMVRLGGVLYGLGGDVLPSGVDQPELKPVMSVRSRIAFIKKVPAGETIGYGRTFATAEDSVIATVPIGYRDGYTRRLSNVGRVIVRDTFAPVAGRVSMDWTIIDVTKVPQVKVGDEVILIGESNTLKVLAEDIAELTDTISYEITCGISNRVPRSYCLGD